MTLDPFGNFEVASTAPGAVVVSGWALDPDTAAPVYVHAYVDGTFGGELRADASRSDIAAAFPGYGPAHGFGRAVSVSAGRHDICLWIYNEGAGAHRLLGCRSVTVGGSPFGNLEGIALAPGGTAATGWAIDPDTIGPVEMHVYVDGALAAAGDAAVARSDVAAL